MDHITVIYRSGTGVVELYSFIRIHHLNGIDTVMVCL